MSKVMITLAVLVASSAILLLLPAAASSEEPQLVVVTNFPATQRVNGAVAVEGVVHQAALTSLREIEVAPVAPSDLRRLVDGGLIATDGFGAVVLSLAGQPKGMVRQKGEIGAILLPDEEAIGRAFEEKGQIQFPLEVKADVPVAAPLFSSSQPRHSVAFPRYRVLLYNSTDRAVSVDVYAYLTN